MIKKIEKLDEGIIAELADSAIKASQFCRDRNFINKLLNRWSIYFNQKTQSKYVWVDEKENVNSICFAIIGDSTKDIHYDISDLKPITKQEEQYITFRKRITKGYASISIKAEAELEIMSSKNPNQGIGSKLLNALEKELIQKDIKEYIVCTNEMCSYQFYEHHGFNLINDKYIDISDLNFIFPEKDKFRLMCYKKVLIK